MLLANCIMPKMDIRILGSELFLSRLVVYLLIGMVRSYQQMRPWEVVKAMIGYVYRLPFSKPKLNFIVDVSPAKQISPTPHLQPSPYRNQPSSPREKKPRAYGQPGLDTRATTSNSPADCGSSSIRSLKTAAPRYHGSGRNDIRNHRAKLVRFPLSTSS
jgi:hypothetical protein